MGVWRIEENAGDLISRLQLSKEERTHIDQFKDTKRYLHWLGSRVLLRTMIDTDEFIELETFSNKRPKLLNFPFQVSISHSHDMAAVAISRAYELGIDIERIHPKVLRVKHKFLSKEEIDTLESVAETQAIEQGIVYWCAKEAMFKWYGKGQVEFAKHLHVRNIQPNLANTDLKKTGEEKHLPIFFDKIDGYILAVAYG